MLVKVVTVFLRRGGRILILKRSRKVGSYQGRWAGISGFIEENETFSVADKFKWIALEEVIK